MCGFILISLQQLGKEPVEETMAIILTRDPVVSTREVVVALEGSDLTHVKGWVRENGVKDKPGFESVQLKRSV
jgi:hypothetical protein